MEAASGLAGVMKVVLALEKGFIPPSLHFENPNLAIDMNGLRVKVIMVPPQTVNCNIDRVRCRRALRRGRRAILAELRSTISATVVPMHMQFWMRFRILEPLAPSKMAMLSTEIVRSINFCHPIKPMEKAERQTRQSRGFSC